MQLHHSGLKCILALFVSLGSFHAVAQDAPKPEYSIKQDEPRVGTALRRAQLTGNGVAVNLPYAQLPAPDRERLHEWWTNIPPGDEPPFPTQGLRSIFEPLRKAFNALHDDGELFVVATIGPDGRATTVEVFASPSKRMGEFAAKLLLLTEFKPAVCSGVPCRMEFPLRMNFRVSAM